jgi:hypothetical protein
MEDWFRRKGYLKANERLEVSEIVSSTASQSATVPTT